MREVKISTESHRNFAKYIQKKQNLIVNAIRDFHHWTVEYRFEEGKHLFIVKF